MPPQRKPPLPALRTLHERHPGFYRPLCEAFADAAAICFSDSHISPIDLEVRNGEEASLRQVSWDAPGAQERASWANRDDATRDGAYSVGLAVIEAELGYVAVQRAETRTGADYYVGPPGSDLEDSHRLEASGVRSGEVRDVNARLRQKVEQARKGKSDLPAFACVVGFAIRTVALSRVERDAES